MQLAEKGHTVSTITRNGTNKQGKEAINKGSVMPENGQVGAGGRLLWSKWWLNLAIPVFLVVITILFYYPSLNYAFEFDDYANIVKYFNSRSNSLATLFLQRSRWISYWLNACYFDLLPQGAKYTPFLYRVGNVAFHCITGVLVFACVRLLCLLATKNKFLQQYGVALAALTAGLFLLHPVATQTVSYVIQGQLEGLAGLFCFALLACFLVYTYAESRCVKAILLTMLYGIAILACGTKEIVIVSPVLIMLVDWFFVAQGDWQLFKSRLWLHGSLLVLILGLYTFLLKPAYFLNIIGLKNELVNNIGNTLTESREQRITPYLFCISQFWVILHYMWIFVWPFSMSVDYDWKLATSFWQIDVLLPLVLLLGIAWWLYKRLKRNKLDVVSFCWLWFFVAVLPRSSIIPSTELLADYKTYIAGFGLFLLFAVGLVRLIEKYFKQHVVGFLLFFMSVILLAAGVFSYQRNIVWRSPEEFWWNIIQNAPTKSRAYNNYGVALCDQKRHDAAIPYFLKSIELDSQYADPLNNIAVSYAVDGKIDLAIGALRRSLMLMPYHPETYNNLATMYIEKGDYKQAEALLFTAIKLRPHYGKAYRNLGLLYEKIKEPEKAWQAFKKCCTQADFDNLEGFRYYAQASLKLKKYEEALAAFEKVLKMQPNAWGVKASIAHIYFATERYEQAEALYRELVRLRPDDAVLLFKLGEVVYAQGRCGEAFDIWQRVREINPTLAVLYPALARCLVKMGERGNARALLKSFIEQEPPEEQMREAKLLLKSL